MANNAYREGLYYNTTRQDNDQFYTYMWKYQCAFTRWTPSNQFLHEHRKYDWKSKDITLARFGFVGWDKKCYWGLFGVQWVKPLPIFQIKEGDQGKKETHKEESKEKKEKKDETKEEKMK